MPGRHPGPEPSVEPVRDALHRGLLLISVPLSGAAACLLWGADHPVGWTAAALAARLIVGFVASQRRSQARVLAADAVLIALLAAVSAGFQP